MTSKKQEEQGQDPVTKYALIQSAIGQDIQENILSEEYVLGLFREKHQAEEAFRNLAMANNSKMCVSAFVREVQVAS